MKNSMKAPNPQKLSKELGREIRRKLFVNASCKSEKVSRSGEPFQEQSIIS